MAGRPKKPNAKHRVIMTRVDEHEYDAYIKLADARSTTVSGLIRRLLHEEYTGRSRAGYATLIQREFVEAIKQIPEDNLDDLSAYALVSKMRLRDLLIEFDRALDAEEILIVNKRLVWNKEKMNDLRTISENEGIEKH